jgi:hypothetical protein
MAGRGTGLLLARAVAVWLALMAAEVAQGTLRTLYVAPSLGDRRARQVGVFSGSAMNLVIASLAASWLRATTTRAQLPVGLVWVMLTVVFEVGLGRVVLRYPWRRVAADYDLPRGGLMPIGLAILAAAPLVAARVRRARGRG